MCLGFLASLKLSNTSQNALFLHRSLKELELDSSYLSFLNGENVNKIEWINLAKKDKNEYVVSSISKQSNEIC